MDISDSVGESWNWAIGESLNSIVVDVVVIRGVMSCWLWIELIEVGDDNALDQKYTRDVVGVMERLLEV